MNTKVEFESQSELKVLNKKVMSLKKKLEKLESETNECLLRRLQESCEGKYYKRLKSEKRFLYVKNVFITSFNRIGFHGIELYFFDDDIPCSISSGGEDFELHDFLEISREEFVAALERGRKFMPEVWTLLIE